YNADMEGSYKVKVELELNEKGQARLAGIQNDYAILSTEVEEIEAEKEAKKEDEKDKEESEDNTAEENKETGEAPTEESAT
ncbi:hypothetical protein, partial [Klebsiella pneumoniae]|uniref:hypothetical protein n=1 Tax=Klebsiella pneumoniae TaxID=573 RepID=UPI0025A2BF45